MRLFVLSSSGCYLLLVAALPYTYLACSGVMNAFLLGFLDPPKSTRKDRGKNESSTIIRHCRLRDCGGAVWGLLGAPRLPNSKHAAFSYRVRFDSHGQPVHVCCREGQRTTVDRVEADLLRVSRSHLILSFYYFFGMSRWLNFIVL